MRRPSPAQGLTAVATLAYVVLATRAIDEPGLHIDEAAHVVPSLAFAKGGLPTNAIIGTGPTLDVGGHSMNIMTFPLAGSLKNFLFVPVAGRNRWSDVPGPACVRADAARRGRRCPPG